MVRIMNYRPPYPLCLVAAITVCIGQIILTSVAAIGDNLAFPLSQADVSREFQLEITPASGTFSIWFVIYALQLAWLTFGIVSVIRSYDNEIIQSNTTLLHFILYNISVIVWLFTWSRKDALGSLVCIVLALYFVCICFGYACADVKNHVDTYGVNCGNKIEIWCHRILVQNAIVFNATWLVIATALNLAVFLHYYLDVPSEVASLVGLTVIGLAIIIWFVLENYVLEKYPEYTFGNYIVALVGLGGISRNVSNTHLSEDFGIAGLTTGLLVITGVMFLLRIILLLLKTCRYEEEGPKRNNLFLTPMKTIRRYDEANERTLAR